MCFGIFIMLDIAAMGWALNLPTICVQLMYISTVIYHIIEYYGCGSILSFHAVVHRVYLCIIVYSNDQDDCWVEQAFPHIIIWM